MSRSISTRRDFLKTSAAAAGAAVPYFWSSEHARAESPGEKLNVAAIGVGGRGTGIGHQAGSLGNMLACADVLRGNAERFASKYDGKCEIYTDYRKILDRNDVDAVTCGTPDHWHAKIAIDALEAGKDVYCEKPLTLTIDEGRLIRRAVEKTGRVLQVGTQQRSEYHDIFLKAVAIARSGRLGEKLHAVSSVGEGRWDGVGPFATQKPPEDLDFDFWLGQAPVVDFTPTRIGRNFRWWLEYSGGQVTDWGVHHTDIAVWALGGENTGAVEVEGVGTFPGLPGDVNIFDFLDGKVKIPPAYNVAKSFDVKMKLPNGNTINLITQENELLISGERGRIRVNRGGLTGKPVEEIEASPAQKQRLDEQVAELYGGPRTGHMANFFACVKNRARPISDVWTHVSSVNSCHMANISMLLNRKVKFDSAKYEFPGDDEANRLMRRKQRKPYAIS